MTDGIWGKRSHDVDGVGSTLLEDNAGEQQLVFIPNCLIVKPYWLGATNLFI